MFPFLKDQKLLRSCIGYDDKTVFYNKNYFVYEKKHVDFDGNTHMNKETIKRQDFLKENTVLKILKDNYFKYIPKIYDFNDNEYCDLTNSSVENYSSGMFSKLQFEDLKKAHTESVVPVSHKDYNNKYSNIDNIRNERNQQNITPLSIKESNDYLNSEYNNNNYISSQRAFKLAKQEEEIEKKNNIWWSNLKTLK